MSGDRWLDRVTATLREPADPPVDLVPSIVARVESGSASTGGARGPIWLGVALAAAAVLLVAVQGRRPGSGGDLAAGGTAVAFEVRLAASKVTLVGDFNGWDRGGTPLVRDGATDRWRATVALPSGVYRYAFLVDDARWMADPTQPTAVDQDFGEPTSLLTVR
jgi:hypothetical protein